MSTLRDIRRHLKSVENIKKITDAMERVAAARLRRAQARVDQARPYATKLKKILDNLGSSDSKHPLFQQREVKKTGLVIIGADRGLSGPYNTNIFTAADKFLKQYNPDNIELMIIGKKAIDYYKKRNWVIRFEQTDWGENFSFHDIKSFSNQLVQWFLMGEFDEIWLIYTHNLTMMNNEVVINKFLNIGKNKAETKNYYSNYIFEPNQEDILADLLPRYCITRIQIALYEAYASELRARIMAMRAASKNSEELIEKLTLTRNKVRQENITREMIEISTGAESY